MLAVGSGEDTIKPFISQITEGSIKIACVNSPESVTVSGDASGIDELSKVLTEKDIFNRKLKVDTAYHSHHMERIADAYLQSLHAIQSSDAKKDVEFYSSVTASRKVSDFDAAYWTQNLVSTVRFSDALSLLAKESSKGEMRGATNIFVEIGPHSALSGPIRQILGKNGDYKYSYVSPILRGQDALHSTLAAVGALHVAGYQVSMNSVLNVDGCDTKYETLGNLPSYPWDHTQKYWHESRLSKGHRFRKFPYHDLLGLFEVTSSLHEPRWRYHFNVKMLPWLKHHVVDGLIIFPGAGYITMAVEALNQLNQLRQTPGVVSKFVLRNVMFSKPIIIPDESIDGYVPDVEVQLVLSRSKSSMTSQWETFRVLSYSRETETWSEHATGLIAAEMTATGEDEVEGTREDDLTHSSSVEKWESFSEGCTNNLDPENFYSMLRATGNDFGPSFCALASINTDGPRGCARLVIPDVKSYMPKSFMQPHLIHPTTLDALNQLAALLFKKECSNAPIMPFVMGEITIAANIKKQAGDELFLAASMTPEGKGSASGSTWGYQKDEAGNIIPVFTASDWQLKVIGEEVIDTENIPFHRKNNYRFDWYTDVNFLTADQFSALADVSATAGAVPNSKMSVRDELELLDKAGAIYLRNALSSMEGKGDQIPAAHHKKLYAWMQQFSALDSTKQLLAQAEKLDEPTLLQESIQAGVEGEMLARMGTNLSGILTGKVDPLALMLEENLLDRNYAEGLTVPSYEHMVKYVDVLAFNKPHMDICEIGAGTGGATMPLLQALDRPEGPLFNRFCYTDISSGFFETAKTKFRKWESLIDFKTLDVCKDPIAQGYQEAQFDMIIASNVLHATPSMAETMTNVRKLLKPGGRLVLVELTRLTIPTNLMFGNLPG